ncbi:MAG: glycerol-3-phosphate dehydrogenase/oxidase [Lysobacterales bacterium]|jgi:glycerol-3-phosphate dehydrogenase
MPDTLTQARPFPDRERLWDEMGLGGAADWDILVIGGGITGAGILREATQMGFRALLVEQGDYAWGTSSRSSKMVHGGLRYLAAGKVSLTRHALHERERLLHEAPGLVERLPYYYPLYRKRFPPAIAAGALFWLYDRLAGVDDHRRIDNGDLEQVFPHLDTEPLKGGYRYTDATTDDARLTLRLLSESVKDGAAARNYTRVVSLLREQGRTVGATLRDALDDSERRVHARVVINATGAWAARLGGHMPNGARIRPQRGSHLVLDAKRFPAPAALFLKHPDDGRRVFVYPWEGRSVVGTTDIPHRDDLGTAARITADELAYLLRVTRQLYGEHAPGAEDVISTWSGVRPIILSRRNTSPSRASREHQVWAEKGLVSCSGGKLTTFHHMAKDVMERAQPFLGTPRTNASRRIFPETGAGASFSVPVDTGLSRKLMGRFGEDAPRVASEALPEELERLRDTTFTLAEVRWALRYESVVHLDDLMLRRTRLGLLLPHGGTEILDAVEPLCRELLGWSAGTWASERERYADVVRRYYSLPTGRGES